MSVRRNIQNTVAVVALVSSSAFAQSVIPPGAPVKTPESVKKAHTASTYYRVELKNGKILVATSVKKTKTKIRIESEGMTLRLSPSKVVSITEIGK